jgi:membrane protein implicated in regulation of membrane protease activity
MFGIETIQPWHWLVFGLILLIAEMLGVGGFLIGIAIACFVQSFIAAFYSDLSWDFQLAVFSFNAIIFTVIYWKFFRRFNESTDNHDINNRALQLVDRQVVIEEDHLDGRGKMQIGDTFWRYHCNEPLAAGDTVKVVGAEGMTLTVQKLPK